MGVTICSLLCIADAAWSQVTPPLSRGNVTVNQDVLDALGPPPSVPQASPLTPPHTTAQTPPAGASSGKPQSQFFGPPGIGTAAATPKPTYTPPAQHSAAATPKPTATPAPAQTAAAVPTAAPAPLPAATPTPAPVASAPAAAPNPAPSPVQPETPPTPTIAQGNRQPVGQVPPPAPPPVAKVPDVAPAQTQTASLATPSAPPISQATIPFTADSSDLTDASKQAVAGIVAKMASSADARLKLSAYASGTPETISQTRRLSLSRALAVRSYLIEQGVKSTRIDVLALGSQVEGGGSADRVDLAVVAP
jgi:outer membrane protein OmpA-like peptidoglycan-associated protein